MAKDINKRIAQKLETIKDRSTFIKENFTGVQEVQEDRIVKKALYKEYQELAEAATDVCAMVLKEEGRILKDDYTNFDALRVCKKITHQFVFFSVARWHNSIRHEICHILC